LPNATTIIRRLFGADSLRMNAFSIEGRTADGGHPLRIFYAHQPCEFLTYVEDSIFDKAPKQRLLGSIRPWQAEKAARRQGYDLALVYGWNAPFMNAIFRDYFFIPQWVSAEVSLQAEAVFEGNSPSRRRDIRKIASNKLSYRVTADTADLEYFYNAMYLPTMTSAHGGAAVLMSYRDMLDRAEAGEAELVYIADAEQPVAGSLIVYDDGQPRLLSLGMLHANRDYYRASVGSAIYLFSFQHLLKKGFDRVDIGRTRPFLRDGTLYFKRRLGMKVTQGSEHGFFLKPLNTDAAIREFLCSSPFIYANGEQLRGIAFFQSDTEARDAAELKLPGLAQFEAVDIRQAQSLRALTR
jgi:hypothetical protein